MRINCFSKDYSLNCADYRAEILGDFVRLRSELGLHCEDVIGLCTFDHSKNVLHYGFAIDDSKYVDTTMITKLGLSAATVTTPDGGWEIYAGYTQDIKSMYEAIELVQKVHSAIELFCDNGTCKLLVI